MRFLILFFLLIFPISEIWLLVVLFKQYGIVVLLYLVVMGYLGLRLIKEEKGLFSARVMQGLMQGGNPLKTLLGSARNLIAGVLLMIPGVITDLIAVVLLLIPVNPRENSYEKKGTKQGQPHYQTKSANDDVIEGEFRRED